MSTLRYTISSIALLFLAVVSLNAAEAKDTLKIATDTLKIATDTLKVATDTLKVATDTLQQKNEKIGVVHLDSTMVISRDSVRQVPKLKSPVYQGAYVNVDIFNPIATLFNGGRFEFVVSFDVSLWQRLFPANVNYTVSNALLENLYWKERTYMTNEKRNVNVGWFEFMVGVRVQVYKSFFMGVNVKVSTYCHTRYHIKRNRTLLIK